MKALRDKLYYKKSVHQATLMHIYMALMRTKGLSRSSIIWLKQIRFYLTRCFISKPPPKV